jgi:hypothetical protein
MPERGEAASQGWGRVKSTTLKIFIHPFSSLF